MSNTAIVIVLELDAASDCPRGTATADGLPPQQFHGWLDLARAITTLARDGDEPDAGATPHMPLSEGAMP